MMKYVVDGYWNDIIVHIDGEKEGLFLPAEDDEEEENDDEYELNNDTNEAELDVESGNHQSNKNTSRGENNSSYE